MMMDGHNFCGYLWSKTYRSDIIKKYKLQFVTGLHIWEDVVFTINYCLNIHSLKTICAPIYNYRWFGEGLTKAYHSPATYFVLFKALNDISQRQQNKKISAFCKRNMKGSILHAIFTDKDWRKRIKTAKTAMKICRQYRIEYPYFSIGNRLLHDIYSRVKSFLINIPAVKKR